jgi:quercetin dioxygenase-like cupin family protein
MNFMSLVALALSVAPVEQVTPILQNEQVTVWDVTWAQGETSPNWDRDTVLVFLTSGSVEMTGADGGLRVVPHQPGDVEFVPRGPANHRRAVSKEAVRAIVIQPAGHSPPPLANTAGVRDAFDRPGIEKAFDNGEVTVWRYTWTLGKQTPLHFHARDVVVVYLADGVLKSSTPDGKSVLNPHSFGFTKFSPRGRVHYEELVEGEARAVMVELK